MSLIASMRRLSIEPDRKLIWLKITIALALGCGLLLSWKLWVSSSRLFPLSPVSDTLPIIPYPIELICFLLLLGLLLAISILAQARWAILAFLALAVFISLWDQTRWQPWFYQYLLMLAALGFYAWKKPEIQNNRAVLNACRLIIVCTYFWSGVQKLNVNFINETWLDLSSGVLRVLPEALKGLPPSLMLIIPMLEICTALGLLTRRFRNAAVILALTTHTMILALLVASGENLVVWPWNVAMALFVVILFWQDAETSPRKILLTKNALHALVLILLGVLPALSLFDRWDSYLSLALYSRNTDQAVIYVSRPVIDRLPAALHTYIWQDSEPFFLDINR